MPGEQHIPPNEKAWTDEHRQLVEDMLPGYMVLEETSDMRVGQWIHISVGGDVRIDNIEEEREMLVKGFEQLGVEVEIPLVGIIRPQDGRMPSIGYKAEIQNWEAK